MGLDISTGVYKARKRCGYTQAEMGKALGVNANTISSYERGKTQPSMEKLMKIAEISGFSLGEVLAYTDYHNVNSPFHILACDLMNIDENELNEMISKYKKLSATKFYNKLLEKEQVIKDFMNI